MKAMITRLLEGRVRVALFALLVSGLAAVAAAPVDVQVYQKADGPLIVLNLDQPTTQVVPSARIWIEYVPHTVWKDMPDGSVWIQDCDNNATFTIGTGEDTSAKPTHVLYQGSGSIIDIGLWVLQGNGWLAPGDKMNYQIMATVVDSSGQAWKLHYHAVVRGGVWDEKFRFEPVK